MEEIRENKMGNTPMLRLIISMSLPAIFSMLVQSLYNIVDSYFGAHIQHLHARVYIRNGNGQHGARLLHIYKPCHVYGT